MFFLHTQTPNRQTNPFITNKHLTDMEHNYNNGELRARFNPEGSLLRRHQNRMMELLLAFDAICRKHGIRYWLIGGTLIGAVRHKGFIPWDDDMDVQMLREDYMKMLKVMPQELGNGMALQCRQTDENYFYQYAKLRDRRSVLDENNRYDRIFKERGIYIDIFPIDRHPKWMQRLAKHSIGHVYKILNRKGLSDQVVTRKVMRWVHLNERIIYPALRKMAKLTGGAYLDGLGVPYVVERHYEDIFPLGTLDFEGHPMPVPGNYDKVLRDQYGDYMKLPDIDSVNLHVGKLEFLD